jgi:hypothetical protein
MINAAGDGLVYSTYLGNTTSDDGYAIAVNSTGVAYVTGTAGANFPLTPDAAQPTGGDMFVTIINTSGTDIVYSTRLGGDDGIEYPSGIAVDPSGNFYVSGRTAATDFPTTGGAYQVTHGGSTYDGFAVKYAPDGTVTYSTYLGGIGKDWATDIDADDSGNAYVGGFTNSSDFPVTSGAFQETFNDFFGVDYRDAYVTKINPAGDALVYSTYLGGKYEDLAYGIAVNNSGSAVVSGRCYNGDFDLKESLQGYGGGSGYQYGDAFVTMLSPDGDSLDFSTYIGLSIRRRVRHDAQP